MSNEVQVEGPSTKGEKMKALGTLSKKLDKDYGEGTLMRMGSKKIVPVPVMPTGFVHWDHETLVAGGMPRARVVEIFGPESAGKTTVALQLIAEQQRIGGTAAFVDAEHALDPIWAGQLGVDVDNLFINQPDDAEQALQVTEHLVKSQAADIIVVDSVAALAPRAELAGEVGDAHVGLVPRLMAQTLRMITGEMRRASNLPILVFINQIREKIGVKYGNPETQPGGRALKFYASVRIDVRRKQWLNSKGNAVDMLASEEMPTGQVLKLKHIKNKVGSPFRTTYLKLRFPDHPMGPGFDKDAQVIDLAFDRGIVAPEKDKSTKYALWQDGKPGDTIAVGKDKTIDAILEDQKLFEAVKQTVIAKLKEPKKEAEV